MKTILIYLFVIFPVFAFANAICVDPADIGWSKNEIQPLPDGSISISSPSYNFNNRDYPVAKLAGTAELLCKIFGRNLVRAQYVEFDEEFPMAVFLNAKGDVIDTKPTTFAIQSIQCK